MPSLLIQNGFGATIKTGSSVCPGLLSLAAFPPSGMLKLRGRGGSTAAKKNALNSFVVLCTGSDQGRSIGVIRASRVATPQLFGLSPIDTRHLTRRRRGTARGGFSGNETKQHTFSMKKKFHKNRKAVKEVDRGGA